MEFKYEKKFENNEKWYTLGTVSGIDGMGQLYAVEVMDPAGKELCDRDEWKPGSVAVAVFGITEDEYKTFETDIEEFDILVEKLKKDIPKDRLFAERNCVRKTDRQDTIDDGKFRNYMAQKMKNNINAAVGGIVKNILNAEKLCIAYSDVTERPAINVNNDMVNVVLSMDEAAIDSFVSTQQHIYKKVFFKDAINGENEDSVFAYLAKIGVNLIGLLLPDKKVVNIPINALFNSPDFRAKKPDEMFCNPMLDRYITSFLQLLRTVRPTEENRDNINNSAKFLDVKIMESLIDAKFLLSQRAVKKEDGKVEFIISVVEQKETGEKLVPVATIDEEYKPVEGNDKVIVTYAHLEELVLKSNLSGFVINCNSKASYKVNKVKIEQVAKFKQWRDEQKQKMEQNKNGEVI